MNKFICLYYIPIILFIHQILLILKDQNMVKLQFPLFFLNENALFICILILVYLI